MGYYTDYQLDIDNADFPQSKLAEIREAIMHMENVDFYSWDDDSWYADVQKWYEQEEDMYKLSLQFPDVRFRLHGSGDDQDDLWDEYWQNGSYQHCHVEIPPYDPDKMRLCYMSPDGKLTTNPPIVQETSVVNLPF